MQSHNYLPDQDVKRSCQTLLLPCRQLSTLLTLQLHPEAVRSLTLLAVYVTALLTLQRETLLDQFL